MAIYGGDTPLLKWETITCEAPAGTTAALPVLYGQLFELPGTAVDDDGSGYKATACTAGDDFSDAWIGMAVATQTAEREIALHHLRPGSAQIRTLRYTGAAPALGDGVQISAADPRKVVGTGAAAVAGEARVMRVIAASTSVEVLF